MPLKLALIGHMGRMGTAIKTYAKTQNIDIIHSIGRGDNPEEGLEKCDVIIDFSLPEASLLTAQAAVKTKKPYVLGTTGHSPELKKNLETLLQSIPVVWSDNFSIGMQMLYFLSKQMASKLGDEYHIELLELHHHHKKDAPSGTAKKLLEIVCQERSLDPTTQIAYGRHGQIGSRSNDEVGVHSLRGGEVIGEHTVFFCGPADRLELTHRAADRRIFAIGALKAAQWLLDTPRAAGIYTMQDVLNFKM